MIVNAKELTQKAKKIILENKNQGINMIDSALKAEDIRVDTNLIKRIKNSLYGDDVKTYKVGSLDARIVDNYLGS